MTKVIKENFLTSENGCRVIQASSEREGATAANIINDNRKNLWVIEDTLPQFCLVDTSTMKNYPKVFNRIGFYCWHEYQSNPELIEVAYARNESQGWTVAGKIRLERTSEKQYFKIKDIPVTEMKLLKLTVLKNFGDPHTYLNQVELGFVKQSAAIENSREKTFSEFVKLTSTERQLKRALEQIKGLVSQQQQLRATVTRQNEVMVKMQDSMKQMSKHIQKMYEIQELQTAKIQLLQKSMSPNKANHRLNQMARVLSSEEEEENRHYIEDNFMNKRTAINKSSSYNKSNRHASNNRKEKQQGESKKASKMQSILRSRQIQNDSDHNLSEYLSNEDERSRHSQKCSELVHKLQRLLVEKQKRQKQLSRKGHRVE